MLRIGEADLYPQWAFLPSLGAQCGTTAEKSSSGKKFASWLNWSLRGTENISCLPSHLEKGLANWDWGPTPTLPHSFAGMVSLEWPFQSREVGMAALHIAKAKTLTGPHRKSHQPISSLEWIGVNACKLRPSSVALLGWKALPPIIAPSVPQDNPVASCWKLHFTCTSGHRWIQWAAFLSWVNCKNPYPHPRGW